MQLLYCTSRFAYMKFACTFGILLFLSLTLPAQDITGIWKGYFYSGYGLYKQQFKYEVQINQLNGKQGPGNTKALKGVTYSYRLASFYGKARFVGIFNKQTKELTLKEDTLEEVKLEGPGFSCLMTCYLEYHKVSGQDVLEGTFSSIVTNKGSDCGDGSVYLERAEQSDFHKEDFLLNKKPSLVKTLPPVARNTTTTGSKKDSSAVVKKSVAAAPKKEQPEIKKPAVKNPPPQTIVKKNVPPVQKPQPPNNNKDTSIVKIAPAPPVIITPPTDNMVKKHLLPVPDIIKQRENPLVKTIVTSSPDIRIDLYDNGEIDGDTITVYHNNEVVAFKRGLSNKPITINIKASVDDPHHEFVMVADNLGSIPPNTALMVVTTGGKRYEVFISSDEQKNAKVIIDYKVPETSSR